MTGEAGLTLDQAIILHRQGRLPDAEFCYHKALQREPNNAAAMHLLGVVRHQLGDHRAAVELIGRAIGLGAPNAAYLNNYGLALCALGQFDKALQSFRRALEICPQYAQAMANVGMVQESLGQPVGALACYREALTIQPYDPNALIKLAMLLENLDRADEAIRLYEDAIEHAPRLAFYVNLAALRISTTRPDLAVAPLQRAIELGPDCVAALVNLAGAHWMLGNLAVALTSVRKAIELKPRHASELQRRATLLKKLGHADEAVAIYERAIAMAASDNGRSGGTQLLHSAQIRLDFGEVLIAAGQHDRAVEQYRQAIELSPELAAAHFSLGNALAGQGRVEEASECLRRAVDLQPDSAAYHSNWVYCQQFREDVTPEKLAAAHAEWDARHGAPLRSTWRPFEQALTPGPSPGRRGERIRLGFVSRHFRQHPVGCMTVRAVECLKEQRPHPGPLPEGEGDLNCEVFCYSSTPRRDAISERFIAAADHWLDAGKLSGEALAERIRGDRIDILFDLGGHLPGDRPLLFARKPAPVQVKWVGYAGSSGLTAMDYLLADRYQVPAGDERSCPEKVLRLPDGYICFDPPADAPEVGPLPALARRHVTFGSVNNPAKINAGVVATWAEILGRAAGSRLLLRFAGFEQQGTRHRYEELFSVRGIGPERLEFLGWAPRAELLADYNRIDIALDPFPFSGGITTCEALWMGVPVITFPGKTFAGRHSLSHLSNAGFTETVAGDLPEYVEMAVRLANDLPRLAKWRRELRARMAGSPLCDGPRFAENLIKLLRAVWQESCQREFKLKGSAP